MLCRPDGVTGPVRWWRSMWRRAAAVDLLWLPVVAFDLAVTTVGVPAAPKSSESGAEWRAEREQYLYIIYYVSLVDA